ncbi:MAG: hypothetical protein AB7P34_22375 [Vicinamibacterales bacterium]
MAIAIGCGTTMPATVRAQPSLPDAATLEQLGRLTQGFEVRDEQVTLAGRAAIPLRFVLKPQAASPDRLIAATKAALTRLGAWHGRLPHTELTVIDLPRSSGLANTSLPGVIVVATPAFAQSADRAVERTLFASVARQYWQVPPASEPSRRWLGEGLASYVAVRGIHEELTGQHTADVSLFGGFFSLPVGALSWSLPASDPRPQVRRFAEVEELLTPPVSQAQRAALALHTLERYLGWAAMQQAVEAFQARWQSEAAGPADLAAIVSAQRGIDLHWFFDQAFRVDARFDYGLASFSSEPTSDTDGEFETRVSLQRFGDAVFAGTSEAREPLQAGRSLKVRTRFENGEAIDDWWDGRDETMELVYRGPARAAWSSVDPGAVLLLDGNRANNTRSMTAPWTGGVARLAAVWMVWLQDVMLASSALL